MHTRGYVECLRPMANGIQGSLACERASSPGGGALWRRGERERERRESLQLRPWNLISTSKSSVAPSRLSCQISANQGEAETSANVNKHWKRRAKGNDVIINVISANQHFASTFSMQTFKKATSEFQKPSLSKRGQVHNLSCEKRFYLHENEKSFPHRALNLVWYRGPGELGNGLFQRRSCKLSLLFLPRRQSAPESLLAG